MRTMLLAAAAALTLGIAAPAFAGSEQPDQGNTVNGGAIYSEQVTGQNGTNGAPTFNTNPQYGAPVYSSPNFDDLSNRPGSGN